MIWGDLTNHVDGAAVLLWLSWLYNLDLTGKPGTIGLLF